MTDGELLTTLDQAAKRGLTSLDLTDEDITDLPQEIGALTRLTRLNLRHNKLTSLPSALFTLSKLEELNLRDNKIAALPPALGDLTNLLVLDLANNRIQEIPAEIGRLENLAELYLGGNRISTLPHQFERLAKLETLGLMSNSLSSLPIELTKLGALKKLNLGNNQLGVLPPEICNLLSLTHLYLLDNCIASLPPEMGALDRLIEVDISNNAIRSLPAKMGRLVRLEILQAKGNQLPVATGVLDQPNDPTSILVECLLPGLASRREPYVGQWGSNPVSRFQYETLQEMVLWRLILLMHSHIVQDTYWRNGAVLGNDLETVLVKADPQNKELLVYATGKTPRNGVLIPAIRTGIQEIHNSVPMLKVKEIFMSGNKPRVFIGSSVEGIKVAEAIQLGLDYTTESTIWSQGVFGLSRGSLETLVVAASKFDYAVLVLTPDDVTTKRTTTNNAPRDNVLFELVFFMGALGRDRVFMVYERDITLELPTDLAGITAATFSKFSDNNLSAAVGPVVTKLKKEMGL
jgi:predicted nucleotide-binding protein